VCTGALRCQSWVRTSQCNTQKSGHVEENNELMTEKLPEIHAKTRTHRQTDFHLRPGINAEDINLNPVVLLSNDTLAFALNLSVYLLIGETSALTMNVAGVIKEWILIFLSSLLFDAPISAMQLWGYFLAFAAVCYYNYQKYLEQVVKDKHDTENVHKDITGDARSCFHFPHLAKIDIYVNIYSAFVCFCFHPRTGLRHISV
jgi:hypothetical protein